jgi:SAM-dependent methyltransferase
MKIFHEFVSKNQGIMNQENNSIHDFDFSLICEYFSSIDRQGPGSTEATLQALSLTGKSGTACRIADIGCGTGAQTFVLAANTTGNIVAIDLFPAFIDRLNARAAELRLQHRVQGVVGNMEQLPFDNEEFDLIWCEGAIYNIGFQRGLTEWRRFLKTGGMIAVTDATWLTDARPAEIETFWNDAYPGIKTIAENVDLMRASGYSTEAVFTLPATCWTDHYYALQGAAQKTFLMKYAGNKTAEDLVANQRHEAALYERFGDYYGYVFYIGRKC